jgi:DNA-binding MarR family transcriptional regulator
MAGDTEPPWLDETEQRAWRGLMAVFSRAMPEIERSLKANDLLSIQYHILVALSEAPDRTLRLSELADGANMSQSRLTHRLRSLVDRGLVVISDDPVDGRAKNASLSAAGMALLESVAPAHVCDVRRLIFDPLTAEQTEALADAVTAVSDHLCCHPEFLNPQTGAPSRP